MKVVQNLLLCIVAFLPGSILAKQVSLVEQKDSKVWETICESRDGEQAPKPAAFNNWETCFERVATIIRQSYDNEEFSSEEIRLLVRQFPNLDQHNKVLWFSALSPFLFPTKAHLGDESFAKLSWEFQIQLILLIKEKPFLADHFWNLFCVSDVNLFKRSKSLSAIPTLHMELQRMLEKLLKQKFQQQDAMQLCLVFMACDSIQYFPSPQEKDFYARLTQEAQKLAWRLREDPWLQVLDEQRQVFVSDLPVSARVNWVSAHVFCFQNLASSNFSERYFDCLDSLVRLHPRFAIRRRNSPYFEILGSVNEFRSIPWLRIDIWKDETKNNSNNHNQM